MKKILTILFVVCMFLLNIEKPQTIHSEVNYPFTYIYGSNEDYKPTFGGIPDDEIPFVDIGVHKSEIMLFHPNEDDPYGVNSYESLYEIRIKDIYITKNSNSNYNTINFVIDKSYMQNLTPGTYSFYVEMYYLIDTNDENYALIQEEMKNAEENEVIFTENEILHKNRMYYFVKTNGTIYKIEKSNQPFKVESPKLDIVSKDNNLAWEHLNGKSYWYEKVNGKFVKQGTYFDTNGVMGDGTIRGREIFDPDSNAWYWLDAIYDGAKAVAKEVWMPYIYQDEDSFTSKQLDQVVKDSNTYTESTTKANMGEQVKKAILNKEGKWVRYDENGKMYKGWVKLENWKEKPEQNGNTYYYDYKTGLMAKGKTIIDGKEYHFDEVTGVCKNPPVQYR